MNHRRPAARSSSVARIVWIDRRQNAAGTPAADLVSRLYVAIKTVYLSRYSKALCTWRPTRKGTYYARAWFNGAGASGTVPNTSPVLKIVVH